MLARLDAYLRAGEADGVGPPRDAIRPQRISWKGIAIAIGCTPRQLTGSKQARARVALTIQRCGLGQVYISPELTPAGTYDIERGLAGVLREVLDGYETRREPLPEDPFHRHHPDYVALSAESGISVKSLRQDRRNFEAINATRLTVGVCPKESVGGGAITYKGLLAYGRELRRQEAEHTRNPGQAARNSVRALRIWMTERGRCEADPVGSDFDDLERWLSDLPAGIRQRNWPSEMRKWAARSKRLQLQQALPESFTFALRTLCQQRGLTPTHLGLVAGLSTTSTRKWCEGLAQPARSSQPQVERLEAFFEVPAGTLTDRLPSFWRKSGHSKSGQLSSFGRGSSLLPADFAERPSDEREAIIRAIKTTVARQTGPYAERLQIQVADRYRLPARSWPDRLAQPWSAMVRLRQSRLRAAGSPRRSRPARTGRRRNRRTVLGAGGVDRYQSILASFFGFLTRPRRRAHPSECGGMLDAQDDDTIKHFDGGLGIPVERLTFGLFLIPDFIVFYMHWATRRAGGENSSLLQFLSLAAMLVEPGEGVVARTPNLLTELEELVEWLRLNPIENHPDGYLNLSMDLIRSDWLGACAEAERVYRMDLRDLGERGVVRTRDPFLPILPILEAERPLTAYMKLVYAMLALKPDRLTQCTAYHLHIRNCVLVLILIQTLLRRRNLCELTYRADNTGELRSEGGVWRIVISREKFKNSDGAYFGTGENKWDYEFDLDDEDGLYELLEIYISETMPFLLRGTECDSFFLTNRGRNFQAASFSVLYRSITINFFAYNPYTGRGLPGVMPHGLHCIRDIGVTDMVKRTGDFSLAAWAIQDSVETVKKNYARFLPKDKTSLVKKYFREARAEARAEFRKAA